METPADRERKRLKRTAYHEAGHAVACIDLDRKIEYATIRPDQESLGRVLTARFAQGFRPDLDARIRTEYRIGKEVLIFLAGPASERDALGGADHGGEAGDHHSAASLASYLYGGDVLAKYLDFMQARCAAMVAAPAFRVRVGAVAQALLDREQLFGSEVRKVCQHAIGFAVARRWTGSPIDGSLRVPE